MSDTAENDTGRKIMLAFSTYLLGRLEAANLENGQAMPAAELSVVRQFLSDNSITLAHVRRGDFGKVAKEAAEEFPFNADGTQRGEVVMLAKRQH